MVKPAKNYNYFVSGQSIKPISGNLADQRIIYHDYHWSLQEIAALLENNNFMIKKIIEPQSPAKLIKKFPRLKNRLKHPMDILIEAVKK